MKIFVKILVMAHGHGIAFFGLMRYVRRGSSL